MSLERINGESLRRRRVLTGFSRAELSARSGLSRNTIWRIETGRMNVARIGSIVSLATALDVEIAELIIIDGEDAA